ncbi:hypothetical protein C0J52_08957 [Blattella germanica]|nr:hypothetical protein C0J52_08957 [Blattella germanica]
MWSRSYCIYRNYILSIKQITREVKPIKFIMIKVTLMYHGSFPEIHWTCLLW